MTCHIMTSYIVARPVAFTATLEGSKANVQSLLLSRGQDTEKRSRWYFLPVSSRGRRDHESAAHAGDSCPSSYLLWSMWKGQPSAFQTKHLSCDISLSCRPVTFRSFTICSCFLRFINVGCIFLATYWPHGNIASSGDAIVSG